MMKRKVNLFGRQVSLALVVVVVLLGLVGIGAAAWLASSTGTVDVATTSGDSFTLTLQTPGEAYPDQGRPGNECAATLVSASEIGMNWWGADPGDRCFFMFTVTADSANLPAYVGPLNVPAGLSAIASVNAINNLACGSAIAPGATLGDARIEMTLLGSTDPSTSYGPFSIT